jgi:hypothetical protein
VRDEVVREVASAAADIGLKNTRDVAAAMREVGLGE